MNVTDEIPLHYGKLRTEIVIPGHATPSLNATLREHHTQKTATRKLYEQYIWATTQNRHPGPVRLEIYRHSPGRLDHDNFVGGTKALVDALKVRQVITDDTDAVLAEKHYEQVQIDRNGPKMTVVVVEDL